MHGEVTLSKGKWEIICSAPERAYYRFNGEKIATTLINPDSVRCHRYEKNQFFYYKRFLKLMINETIVSGPFSGIYFALRSQNQVKHLEHIQNERRDRKSGGH